SSRTQPASNHPQPAAPAAAPPSAPRMIPARRLRSLEGDAPVSPSKDNRYLPGAKPAECPGLDFELLENGRHGDDVALELQLGLLEAGGDADQLREVQDRQLVALPGRRLELLLPRVERQVAERARRHHRVGARVERLLDRLDQLAERG